MVMESVKNVKTYTNNMEKDALIQYFSDNIYLTGTSATVYANAKSSSHGLKVLDESVRTDLGGHLVSISEVDTNDAFVMLPREDLIHLRILYFTRLIKMMS